MKKTVLKLVVLGFLANLLVSCNSGDSTSTQQSNITQDFMHQLTYVPLSGDPKLRVSRGFHKSPLSNYDTVNGQVDMYFAVDTNITSENVSFYSSQDCSGSPIYPPTSLGSGIMQAGHHLIAESNAYLLCSIFGGSNANANCALEKSMTRSISFNFSFSSPSYGQVSHCLTSLNNPAVPESYGELIANYDTNQACTSQLNPNGSITYSNCGFSKNYFVPVYANGWISESLNSNKNVFYKGAGVNVNLQLNTMTPTNVPQNISLAVLNASGAIESTIQIKYPGGSGAYSCALTSSNPNCAVLISTKWSTTPAGLYTLKFNNSTLSGVPLNESTIIMQVVGPATYLQQTGETSSASYCTNMTQSYESLVDCKLQAGVPLPGSGGRFQTTTTSGVVYDNLLHVVWDTTPIASGGSYNMSWTNALGAVAQDINGGYNWRLPTVNELKSLINYDNLANGITSAQWLNQAGFEGIQPNYYWTSSVYGEGVLSTYFPVWVVQMGAAIGHIPSLLTDYNNNFGLVISTDTLPGDANNNTESLVYGVLAVASVSPMPSSIAPALVPQTGESSGAPACANNVNKAYMPVGSECNSTITVGVAWPQNRFVPVGLPANCMLDNLTGLIWLKDSTTIPANDWFDGLESIENANTSGGFCGYTDWRMPNVNELGSLINYGASNATTWLTDPIRGFIMNSTYPYWASSLYDFTDAWPVNMQDGSILGYQDFFTIGNIWPVRGGVDVPHN